VHLIVYIPLITANALTTLHKRGHSYCLPAVGHKTTAKKMAYLKFNDLVRDAGLSGRGLVLRDFLYNYK
jgi:hypothetical protein